ncbi:SMI1/KNR4 family protein [Nonomuraea sp. NPDC047897]|uniref:SMI1/KNR4 family protein n=1 Tax=Nonomuraea sp. NPDC047897 TaxID=3364346 RepID=UPI0037101E44
MLKLVRAALTAAVLAALAVRVRRRARLPGPEPAGDDPVAAAAAAGSAAPRPARFGARRPRRIVPMVFGAGAVMVAALTLAAYTVMPDRFGRVRQAEVAGPAATRATAQAERTPETGPGTPAAAPGCHPQARPVVVRPLDPRVGRAVNRQWRRIERWLKTRAPRTYAVLEGPGRAGTIAVAESQMGVAFPDDLRASLLRHDGSAAFGFGHPAHLGVREIRDAWRALCREEGLRRASVADGRWHGGLIPVQRRAGGGWSVLRARTGAAHRTVTSEARPTSARPTPAASATTGTPATSGTQATPEAHGTPAARSGGRSAYAYYALVRATADALERGGLVQGREPRVVRGSLRWTPPARSPGTRSPRD